MRSWAGSMSRYDDQPTTVPPLVPPAVPPLVPPTRRTVQGHCRPASRSRSACPPTAAVPASLVGRAGPSPASARPPRRPRGRPGRRTGARPRPGGSAPGARAGRPARPGTAGGRSPRDASPPAVRRPRVRRPRRPPPSPGTCMINGNFVRPDDTKFPLTMGLARLSADSARAGGCGRGARAGPPPAARTPAGGRGAGQVTGLRLDS